MGRVRETLHDVLRQTDAVLLALSTIALVGSTYNAFLYFRF